MAAPATTLSDKFSLRGHWWLPETPHRKVGGLLEFDPHGATDLTLDGTLREIPKGKSQGFSAPVILGQTLNGKACTVIDAHVSNFQVHSPGTATTAFFYNQLFVGGGFVNPAEVVFESARIGLTDLSGWLDRHPFTVEDNHGSKRAAQVVITYDGPRVIRVPVGPIQASPRISERGLFRALEKAFKPRYTVIVGTTAIAWQGGLSSERFYPIQTCPPAPQNQKDPATPGPALAVA